MSNTKTGLMYSELSNRVYWGTINTNTGVARSGKKDITSDFVGVMLQKFPVGYMQDISVDGKVEATVIMLDEKAAPKYKSANDMYKKLDEICSFLLEIGGIANNSKAREIENLLKKARGES